MVQPSPRNAGTHSGAAPAEVLIVSYPKTGRTWLRMMIGRYLCSRYMLDVDRILDTPYLTSQAHIRTAKFIHDRSDLKMMASWRTLSDSKDACRSKRILLLTRSIEDTMVSAFFQITKRLRIYEGGISSMLRDERYGVQKFIGFYDAWYRQQKVPVEFAEISYEDMHTDPVRALTRALEFIGEKDVDGNSVRSAVEYASFDNMRKIEHFKILGQNAMRPADPGDVDSHKVRRGIVGGYSDYLSEDDMAYIRESAIAADCPFVRTASA